MTTSLVRDRAKIAPPRLPTFLVIGAAKCGTTSLAAYLAAHPLVFMAHPKEVRFFSSNWERGVEWYARKFATAPAGAALGEASPQYTQNHLYPWVAERIASLLPEARLIYLVRDPIAQMRSFHRHLVHKGKEPQRSFRRAVREQPYYLATASYGRQLATYRQYFDAETLLVLPSDQLLHERESALRQVLEHIGVDSSIPSPNLDEVRNTGEDKLALPAFLSLPRALWRHSARVTGKLPRRWRHTLRSRLGRPLPAEASALDAETARWVRERLAPDLELFEELTSGGLAQWTSRWIRSRG